MREIKFRAWDTAIKRMIEWDELKKHHLSGHFDSYNKGEYTLGEYCSFQIMQYTGLTDHNGKEIYEGDLIKVVGAESGEMIVHVDDITILPLSTLYPAGEIIGNVHENPVLLEDKA
jgi:uncharacterized phage protein (TIGR01671 family)